MNDIRHTERKWSGTDSRGLPLCPVCKGAGLVNVGTQVVRCIKCGGTGEAVTDDETSHE